MAERTRSSQAKPEPQQEVEPTAPAAADEPERNEQDVGVPRDADFQTATEAEHEAQQAQAKAAAEEAAEEAAKAAEIAAQTAAEVGKDDEKDKDK